MDSMWRWLYLQIKIFISVLSLNDEHSNISLISPRQKSFQYRILFLEYFEFIFLIHNQKKLRV